MEGKEKDWPAFFKACVRDEPNMDVISTLRQLHDSGSDIWIWSGRSDEVALETERWLWDNGCARYKVLRMRKHGDHQPDETLKAAWLGEMDNYDRKRLVAIFDDRDRVVAMWRKKGVTCFQVADGDF